MDEFANRDKNSLNSVNFLFKIQIGGGGVLQITIGFYKLKKTPKPKTNIKRGRNSFKIQFPKLFADLYYFSKMIF